MMGVIKYPFAFDEKQNLISINEIDRRQRHDHRFTCPQCGRPMLPRLGEKRVKHFYHSENQSCGVESYIHKVAKILLERRINERKLPFMVECDRTIICEELKGCRYKSASCSCCINDKFDLLEDYDLPAIVEPVIPGSETVFKPDVCLRSSHPNYKEVFIEVWYKHQSSEEKIHSGFPIIEIHIESEDDLLALSSLDCFTEGENIQCFNFTKTVTREDFLGASPDIPICALINPIKKEDPSKRESCEACSYYGTWYDGAVFCRRNLDYSSRKGTFDPSRALTCEDYHHRE